MHRRRAKDFVFTDANGDVTIVGRSEAFVVNPLADFADVFLDLMTLIMITSDYVEFSWIRWS